MIQICHTHYYSKENQLIKLTEKFEPKNTFMVM